MAAFLIKGFQGKTMQCPHVNVHPLDDAAIYRQQGLAKIMEAEENKKKCELDTASKNARLRKLKTSGRKRHRDEALADDYTSFPVPDSISARSLNKREIGAFSKGDYVHSAPQNRDA